MRGYLRGDSINKTRVLLLLVLVLAFALPACSGGGGGGSTGGGGNSSISGSVFGGAPLSGFSLSDVTVTLYEAGNPAPLGSATTNSSGYYSISFTDPNDGGVLYAVATNPDGANAKISSKLSLISIVSTAGSILPPNVDIDETTTVATVEALGTGGMEVNPSGQPPVILISGSTLTPSKAVSRFDKLADNTTGEIQTSSSQVQSMAESADALSTCVNVSSAAACQTMEAGMPNGASPASTLVLANAMIQDMEGAALTNAASASGAISNACASLGGSGPFSSPCTVSYALPVPEVLSVTPQNNATGIALANTTITATFNEAMDPSTFNSNTTSITASDGSITNGSIVWNSADTSFTFTPSSPLSANTVYIITLKIPGVGAVSGVKAANGDFLAKAYPWQFTTGSTQVASGTSPEFLYALNDKIGYVSTYLVNTTTGTLTTVNGTAADVATDGTNAYSLMGDPAGQFLFAVNFGAYVMKACNASIPNTDVPDYYKGTISDYSVNPATGALTGPISTISVGGGVLIALIDPTGQFLYVLDPSPAADGPGCTGPGGSFAGVIYAYKIDPAGELLKIGSYQVGISYPSTSFNIDPTGKFLYVCSLNSIYAYTIDSTTGALKPVNSGSPYTVGNGSLTELVIDPSGKYAYAVNGGRTNGGVVVPITISSYSIGSTSGALQPVTKADGSAASYTMDATGGDAVPEIKIDPAGKFLYASDLVNGELFAYTLSSGQLASVSGSPYVTGQTKGGIISIDETGEFLYVGGLSGDILAYTINPGTGALTNATGSPYPIGQLALPAVIDPSGKFLYTGINSTDGNILTYTIDPGTGALTNAGGPYAAGTNEFGLFPLPRVWSYSD